MLGWSQVNGLSGIGPPLRQGPLRSWDDVGQLGAGGAGRRSWGCGNALYDFSCCGAVTRGVFQMQQAQASYVAGSPPSPGPPVAGLDEAELS